MDKANIDEKRKNDRVGFTTRVEILLKTGGKQIVLDADSKDLSQRGIFAVTGDSFPENAPCMVNIHLTGGIKDISLQIQGRVVRQTQTGVGIVFESMDLDVYSHLKNIVRYNTNNG